MVVEPEYWDNIGQPIARSLSCSIISTLFMKKNRSIMLKSRLGHIAENESVMRDLPTIIDLMYDCGSRPAPGELGSGRITQN